MSQNRDIYIDNAAGTPLDSEVFSAMEPWLHFSGNASATHAAGQRARAAIDAARRQVADVLSASYQEVVFTSGGTESVNLAILGAARQKGGGHIIVSAIEHSAVLGAATQLEREGFAVTRIGVDADGLVRVEEVVAAIQDDTILVSVMTANNEIGTIQPIADIVRAVKGQREDILVHTDACQAAGAMDITLQALGSPDMLTLNGSKIYGPQGVGVLYVKQGIQLQPLQFGGSQEFYFRPGTENVAAMVGMGEALKQAEHIWYSEAKRLVELRNSFITQVISTIPGAELNGHSENRLPNNANIFFPGIDADSVLFELSQQGIYASRGSACTSGLVDPSHVLLAIGRSKEEALQSIRFTLGRSTTKEDCERIIDSLKRIILR